MARRSAHGSAGCARRRQRVGLQRGRDPTLARVYFAKGVVHRGLEKLPELVPASFVKGARAYLLDPKPGTYSLVAVASDFAPPLNPARVAGVRATVASGPGWSGG